MRIDRLTREDARILMLERGTIRGHTTKIIWLEPDASGQLPELDALREYVEARLDLTPRLRQRLLATPLGIAPPVWVDDSEFDIARQVTSLAASEPLTPGSLAEIVSRRMTERLDASRPLWHLDLVEHPGDESKALIWRIHHSLADGATCMRMANEVIWSDDPIPTCLPTCSWCPGEEPGGVSLFCSGLADCCRRLPRRRWMPSGMSASLRKTLRRELSRTAAVTPLAGRAGASRGVAFAVAPLEDCHRAGKAIDASVTLNDVVLALLAGGVRAWLLNGSGPLEGIRVKIPVSLHHPGEGDTVANRDSYFIVDLPVAEPDIAKRVIAINRETSERKLDHDAETLYRLGSHPALTRWAMSPRVFTFNISNVHGPNQEVYVLGSRVRELYSVAEIAERHALRVSVISCAGRISFGLCADTRAVQDLHVLADGIRHSTSELLAVSVG
jgi:diacylglycerol O-acyltransferase / wax synthase